MRRQLFTQNSAPPLDTAARDLLSTVDYLVGQLSLRDGQIDAAQIAMLRESATMLRRELREKSRTAA
jgi:hypothetical protein